MPAWQVVIVRVSDTYGGRGGEEGEFTGQAALAKELRALAVQGQSVSITTRHLSFGQCELCAAAYMQSVLTKVAVKPR